MGKKGNKNINFTYLVVNVRLYDNICMSSIEKKITCCLRKQKPFCKLSRLDSFAVS